jgi:WD40 repeat protein
MPNNNYDYDSLTAMALTPDRQLLAIATQGGLIRLLDAQDGSVIHEWVAHRSGINRLLVSPDGRLLVSAAIDPNIGDDGLIRVWGILP